MGCLENVHWIIKYLPFFLTLPVIIIYLSSGVIHFIRELTK